MQMQAHTEREREREKTSLKLDRAHITDKYSAVLELNWMDSSVTAILHMTFNRKKKQRKNNKPNEYAFITINMSDTVRWLLRTNAYRRKNKHKNENENDDKWPVGAASLRIENTIHRINATELIQRIWIHLCVCVCQFVVKRQSSHLLILCV